MGESFGCLLHADSNPSAALWRHQEDAHVLYHDFHAGKHGERAWLPLALVRARLAGRTGSLAAPELAVWKLRLAREAGLLEPLAFERPPAPRERLEPVWQGFLDLLALRWQIDPEAPAPFTVRFASAWCGLPKRQVHEALVELARTGTLQLVGRDPRGTRLWLPPDGVMPVA